MEETNRELRQDLEEVSEIIRDATDDANELIRAPLKQTFRSSGKLLRPSLMLWAAGCGRCGNRKKLLMAASAVEMLHTASLIHDDIIDDGEVRRGLPAVHSLFGNSVAVYTGDFTIIKSYKLLHESGNDDLIYDFILATEKLCKSDIVQYRSRGTQITKEDYLEIAAGKTGALFALSMKLGARLGGLPEGVCRSFADLGERFGIAFQVADDCLDYVTDGSVNKSTMRDLREGIRNMPLLLALERDDGRLCSLLSRELTPELLPEISSCVVRLGGVREAGRFVCRQVELCRESLRSLPVPPNNRTFMKMLDRMEEQNR